MRNRPSPLSFLKKKKSTSQRTSGAECEGSHQLLGEGQSHTRQGKPVDRCIKTSVLLCNIKKVILKRSQTLAQVWSHSERLTANVIVNKVPHKANLPCELQPNDPSSIMNSVPSLDFDGRKVRKQKTLE